MCHPTHCTTLDLYYCEGNKNFMHFLYMVIVLTMNNIFYKANLKNRKNDADTKQSFKMTPDYSNNHSLPQG